MVLLRGSLCRFSIKEVDICNPYRVCKHVETVREDRSGWGNARKPSRGPFKGPFRCLVLSLDEQVPAAKSLDPKSECIRSKLVNTVPDSSVRHRQCREVFSAVRNTDLYIPDFKWGLGGERGL